MVTPFDQVPAAVERVQRELVLARFLGKIAVDQGLAELRSRIESVVFPAVPGGGESTAEHAAARDASPDVTSGAAPGRAETPSESADADVLALADYDHLPASDIVSKLAGLEPDELDAIERYEAAHRQRRTVLGKIRQLRSE